MDVDNDINIRKAKVSDCNIVYTTQFLHKFILPALSVIFDVFVLNTSIRYAVI